MRNLPSRIAVETLKELGFSDDDIEYSHDVSEEYRRQLTLSDEYLKDKLQLVYELGVLAGLARGLGLDAPKAMAFVPRVLES